MIYLTLCRCRVLMTAIMLGMVLTAVGALGATAAPPAAAAAASAGCGKQEHHSTGLFNLTAADGKQRTRNFRVQVPADYDASKPYSLNFVFHAANGNPAQSYAWGLQKVAGAAESGIFVFPEGINFQREGVGWDDTSTGYDLPFFDNMLSEMAGSFCIDRNRVFVAGFPWGGDFVISLICNRGSSIRAAAANSTTDEFKNRADYASYQGMPCPAAARPAVRFEHAVGGDSQYPAPLFASTSKLLQVLNSCSTASTKAPSSTEAMSCLAYGSCKSAYTECAFDAKLGHSLPPNWAKDTWAFFSTFQ